MVRKGCVWHECLGCSNNYLARQLTEQLQQSGQAAAGFELNRLGSSPSSALTGCVIVCVCASYFPFLSLCFPIYKMGTITFNCLGRVKIERGKA